MKSLLGVLLGLACFSSHVRAEQSSLELAPRAASDILAQLPPCAATCLISAVTTSPCPIGDIQCTCHNISIQSQAAKCILQNCTLSEALSTQKITAAVCKRPKRDRSGQYVAVSVALGAIAVLCVIARLVFKQFFSQAGGLAADDIIILGTLALRISCTVINVEGLAAHGIGKDVWTLPLSELVEFAKWLYIMEVLYIAELSLIKLSLSLFYVRIFPGKTIRRLHWATVIFNILFGVGFALTAIFQCAPIHYFWMQFVSGSKGKCINLNAFGWAHAAISVAVDVWMIALPSSQIPKLSLHWTKKVGVGMMFFLGAFVTVVSILRLRSLVAWANSTNPTWDQWDVVYWSTIEVNVGMICTCLPAFRLILVRAFPQISRNHSHGSTPFSHGTQRQSVVDRKGTEMNHRMSDFQHKSNEHTWTRIEETKP